MRELEIVRNELIVLELAIVRLPVDADDITVTLDGFVRPPLFVIDNVPVPVDVGVNVNVTGVVLFSVTVVGLNVPVIPDMAGVTIAVVVPLGVSV